MIRFLLALLLTFIPMHMAAAQDGRQVKVITSFSILGDITKKIGGGRVQVENIVGPDADAHAFEPSPKDSRKLAGAEVLVLQGLGFDDFAGRMADAAGFAGQRVIVSKGIKVRMNKEEAEEETHHDEHAHEHHHGPQDPHTWHNPMNMIVAARNIAAALTKVDPAGGAVYEANLASVTNEMRALDDFAQRQFAAVPKEKRVIITSHDALGYLGDAYGITILPAAGLSTMNDTSAKATAALISQARAAGTKAMFLENIGNAKMLESIAKELGTAPTGKLYTDALSATGPATTYADLFRYNVMTIAGAMGK